MTRSGVFQDGWKNDLKMREMNIELAEQSIPDPGGWYVNEDGTAGGPRSAILEWT